MKKRGHWGALAEARNCCLNCEAASASFLATASESSLALSNFRNERRTGLPRHNPCGRGRKQMGRRAAGPAVPDINSRNSRSSALATLEMKIASWASSSDHQPCSRRAPGGPTPLRARRPIVVFSTGLSAIGRYATRTAAIASAYRRRGAPCHNDRSARQTPDSARGFATTKS